MCKIVDARVGKSLGLIGLALLAACETLPLSSGPEGIPHFRLEEVNGRVLVTRGTAYFVAADEQELEVGDRVVSMENAEALLVFTQTDEQGERIGEECQLRLPASAQITLTAYADCTNEDAIVLNNIDEVPAEPTPESKPATPVPSPRAETENSPPTNFSVESVLDGGVGNTSESDGVVSQTPLAEPRTAQDVLRQAAYQIRIEPYLSDEPLILQQGRSAQVDFRFGRSEAFVPFVAQSRSIRIRLLCPFCETSVAEQVVEVPLAPVDTLFSILPARIGQGDLVFAIEMNDVLVRRIPFQVQVQSADQYIDALAAPLVWNND